MDKWPIGVFTSIDAGLGYDLGAISELDIPTIQLHAPAPETRTAKHVEGYRQQLADLNLQLTAVFGGFAGESYQNIPTVERTVGLVPESTRDQRLQEMKLVSDFASDMDCSTVALHLGFVPHDRDSELYRAIVETTRQLCQYVGDNHQNLHLETGQETATALVQFMDDTEAENLFVNFDPANMILYGTGQPIEALQQLGHRVRSVHCKDARWSEKPGETWGEETALGSGDVDIEKFLRTLDSIGYTGPLTIEREIPQEPERQKQEIKQACELLNQTKSQIFKSGSE